MRRPCLECGVLITYGVRCINCERERERRRGSPGARGYGHAHRKDRALYLGSQCEGCGTEAPPLHLDHLVPGDPQAGYRTLCASCHGERGARRDRAGY